MPNAMANESSQVEPEPHEPVANPNIAIQLAWVFGRYYTPGIK